MVKCDKCSGFIIVSIDWLGKATIEASSSETLLSFFSLWLFEVAKKFNKTPEEIALDIGKEYEKKSKAGCAHCFSVIPETNPKDMIEAEVGQWEILCICPGCGAYRWLTYETHGHAEIPIWGNPTREDIKRFEKYLTKESKRRNHALTTGSPSHDVVNLCESRDRCIIQDLFIPSEAI